jgi:beta-lactamase regulating signal transducer with metallopeptidase domain
MTAWTALAAQPFFRSLSVALSQFLWQGAAVAAGFAVADFALRRRQAGARARYALACAALTIMVALPAATLFRGAGEATQPPFGSGRATALEANALSPSGGGVLPAAGRHPLRMSAATLRPVLLAAWLAGVFALSLRLLAGWAVAVRLVERRSRPATAALAASFARLTKRLALSRPVRLLESAAVEVPTALGWMRPVVLVPLSGLTGFSPTQIEALLAHELAHLRRHDYLVNLAQCAAETLLFYHPAVWWVSGRIRAERENCCDDIAVAATGDARVYAAALLELEEKRGVRRERALALAADGGTLLGRIARLFPDADLAAHSGSRRAAGAVTLSCVLLLGAAARVSTLALADEEPRVASSPGIPAAAADPSRPAASPVLVSSAQPEGLERDAREPGEAPASSPASPATPDDTEESADSVAPAPAPAIAPAPPEPEKDPAVGNRLTAEELIAFRMHGVTPEFLRELTALGYTRASSDDLVALRVHGVSAADIGEFQRVFGRISLQRCISFRIHGVTPAWLRDLSAAGLPRISPDQAEALRIHGVSADSLRRFREAGYKELTADQAVALRIHGVDPADAAAWTAMGFAQPGIEELVSARIHGVDARYVQEMRAEGVTELDLEELVSLRIHGVTAPFVREMKALGFFPLSAEEAVTLRIHGVTPDFVRGIQGLQVAPLSPDDAVSLAIHGVTLEFVGAFRALGYTRLSPDDLTSLRIHGVTPDQARSWNRDAGARLSVEDLVEIGTEGRRRSK